jgi:hypothetical protein
VAVAAVAVGSAGLWLELTGAPGCEVAGGALGAAGPPPAGTTVGLVLMAPERRAAPLESDRRAACDCELFESVSGGAGLGGASPLITDRGSDESPIRCPASLVTDHVNAAVTAIPSSAATAHRRLRRVRVISSAP